MTLSKETAEILDKFGPDVLDLLIQTGLAEVFRNYMIHRFGWFKGNFIPHSKQHRIEATWYKFYIDHGRIPKSIDPHCLVTGVYTQRYIEEILESIDNIYIEKYGYDVLEPREDLRVQKLTIDAF